MGSKQTEYASDSKGGLPLSAQSFPDIENLKFAIAIHIGASSISMLVSQAHDGSTVEYLEQPIPLARDIFRKGKISRSTTERCVEILQGYLDLLQELGIDKTSIQRAVATNILTEVPNHDVFLNRLFIACGIQVEILDDGQMTRLIYLKTKRRLKDTPSMKEEATLVVHVGPGNTRAILFQKGLITCYTSYRLGTHRTAEAAEKLRAGGEESLSKLIHEHIHHSVSQIQFDFNDYQVKNILLIGYEIQLLEPFLSKQSSQKITLKSLKNLAEKSSSLSLENCRREFRLDYHTSAALLPSLIINSAIIEAFDLNACLIPRSNYERGILRDLPISSSMTDSFKVEVTRSAKALSKRYLVHQKHANHVASLATQVFEATSAIHGLNDHDLLLLNTSALLHECGGFISSRSHHKHSQYIIENSELFGLGKLDISLIALIARYHRRSSPKNTHPAYAGLSSQDRIRVLKLSAILRVADALERTHTQRIRILKITSEHNSLQIQIQGTRNASIERLALKSKGDLFREIFGLSPIIQEANI